MCCDTIGRSFDEEIKKATAKGFRAFSLNQSCCISLDSSIRELTSNNVLALVEGHSRKVLQAV